MKAVIVIHSTCGNTYLVGKAFEDALTAQGAKAVLYRVADADWVEKPDVPPKSARILQAMRALPEAAASHLLDADLVLFGSPVYFGNVSAEMKAFMDSTGSLWFHGKLVGKRFAAFVSCGNAEGGGDLCLQTMHTYSKYMGMLSVPLPVNVLPGENVNAHGVIQYSNGKPADQLDEKTQRLVACFAALLAR